jgi:predicted Fe-Mo cluster-binding NifX family protein
MASDTQGIVVLRFDEDGEQSYHVFGDAGVRLFIVDERSPNDRVYEVLSRDDPATFRDLVPEGAEIGSSQDERHAAIEHRVNALRGGRPFLATVEVDDGE